MKHWLRHLPTITATFVALLALNSCGSNENDKETSTNSNSKKLSWDKDVGPVVAANCSASNCHGSVSPSSIVFQDNEPNFKAKKLSNIDRLGRVSSAPGYMPKNGEISTVVKNILLDFLAQ